MKEALSSYGMEGTIQQRGGWISIVAALFGFLPHVVQLGMRSIFRKRMRALLTFMTLSVSGIAFLAVQTTAYDLNAFANHQFSDTYHFDMIVSVPAPMPYQQFQDILGNVQGITKMEPLSWLYVDTQWGRALLTGVDPASQLYQKQVVTGHWLSSSASIFL